MNQWHRRRGEIRTCEICGKETYYKKTVLRKRNPRTCSKSHAAILRHREGWVSRARFKQSKKNVSGYRVDAFRAYGEICQMCGYCEDARLLDVDHKNENHKDDRLENLQVLCVMCHAKLTRGVICRGNLVGVEN